jgi:RES domain-containing protein
VEVEGRRIEGAWIRHVPHGADLFGRAEPPADGRWQRGKIVGGLYLADGAQTATAEWYRALAEQGFSPQDHVPHDHHRWQIDVELADLTTADRLARVGLAQPTPHRRTWSAYQDVGEQLRQDDWAGVVAPSAARPKSLIVCLFADEWPPKGCMPVEATTVGTVPPRPRGMAS